VRKAVSGSGYRYLTLFDKVIRPEYISSSIRCRVNLNFSVGAEKIRINPKSAVENQPSVQKAHFGRRTAGIQVENPKLSYL